VSDMIDGYKAMHDHRKALRRAYGISCPTCKVKRPRATPSILLPQQRCRLDGYVDPRPELTHEQWGSV